MPRKKRRPGQTNQIIYIDVQGERYHVECDQCLWTSRFTSTIGSAKRAAHYHRRETGCVLR